MKLMLLSFLASVFFIGSSHSQTGALKESITRGNDLYTDFCMSCHLPDGKGVENVYPPLAQSDYLLKNRVGSIHAIKYGLQGPITVNGKKYDSVMAPLGLLDDEVADVMNYITNSWGNKNNTMIIEAEVSKIKK